MRVLLTGGTGHIGSAVLGRLVAAGHQVSALVRDAGKADAVKAKGAGAIIGDLSDGDALHELAARSDGVIHLASPGDATGPALDETAATAFLRALSGTDRPYLHTAGVWEHGSGTVINESTPMNPPRLTAWRASIAERVLAATDVRTAVVAPAVAYGHGGGLVNLVAAGPRTEGPEPALTMIGHGEQRWSTVHVDDLAELYVLALEKAPAGSYFIGAAGASPTVRQITEAVSNAVGLSGRVEPEPVAQTLDRLGLLGEALLLDQQAQGEAARRLLGWAPARPDILRDIARTHFAPVA
ncbi:epimerase [Spongiactinospora rosea]|uniref:Epimerase n=1 Tax=Spongiactinospora rosea TaxID=2248750 RepID=A0A366M4B7_9ACTN|nr:NAD-dependent epimerase/dehydratase family protein [Spongiactinospora rosea]RBQ20282.1 epimerase [Spongiactinospora rosea]